MKAAPIIRRGFVEGVKASHDPSSISPNSIWEARNVRSDDSGILRIKNGSVPVLDSHEPGSFQGFRRLFGGFLAAWNRNLYKYDLLGNETLIASDLIGNDAANKATIVHWSRNAEEVGYVFGGNGIVETDGETAALLTPYTTQQGERVNLLMKYNADDTQANVQDLESAVATCKYAILKASLSQRIAIAGSPLSPNSVFLSSPMDATYFPSDQIIQLPDDGDEITGLANFNNSLVIFRNRDVWAFFGSSVTDAGAYLVLQDGSVGCVENKTIVDVTGVGLVFLGSDNVYALKGVSGVENQAKAVPIGDDIYKYLNQNKDYFADACGIYFDREYRLCLPNAVTDEKVFVLNLKNMAGWYPETASTVNHYEVANNRLYGTVLNEKRILRMKEGLLDDGKPIPFHVSFRREDLSTLSRIKKVYLYILSKGTKEESSLHFFGETFGSSGFNVDVTEEVNVLRGTDQNLDITLVIDGQEVIVEEYKVFAGRLNHEQLARSEPIRIYEARFRPSLKGTFIQVRVNGLQPEQDISVFGYGIEYSPSGRMKSNGVIHS